MHTVSDVANLYEQLHAWRRNGESIALVPTMGNLHAGHLHLVEEAQREARRVVVSLFVNPLQFGPTEDFAAYPRTIEEDSARLKALGVDVLFMPTVADMYPCPAQALTYVEVPALSDELCGQFRPGHFRGVATVVMKLFNLVQPDVALFGEKDFQQLMVIRRMVADLNLPIRIVGVPTVREADGLAMSSRNGYLSVDERRQAGQLYAQLRWVAEELTQGRRDFTAIEQACSRALEHAGFTVDYVAIRRREDLGLPAAADSALVALAAARLGRARLIDNLRVDLD
jgi:pantoate--beta-alanine ligase